MLKNISEKIRLNFLFIIFISLFHSFSFTLEPEIFSIVHDSPNKAYKYILKNGLTLIVVPDARNPLGTIHFMLDAGSDREKKGSTGLAHFFEHMMFRKTKNAPEGNYDRVLNSIGGKGNAATSESFVTFYSNFPAPAIETMLKLEADRFQNLEISDPYFSTEKGAIISERKLRIENDPMQRGQEYIRSTTERNTPLEWITIGSKTDVENMSIETARKFYKDFYTPDNTILVLGGPFKPDQSYQLVSKYFGQWQGKLNYKHFNYPNTYFTRDIGKSFICSASVFTKRYKMVYPATENNLESQLYASLFEAMLNDNQDGTFNRRLIKQNLATQFSFYQSYWLNEIHPYNAIFSLSKEQNFNKAKDFWLKSVEEVYKKPLTDKIKNQVLKQMTVANADTAEKMTSLVNMVIDNTFFMHDFQAAGKQEKILKTMNQAKFKTWLKKNLNEGNFYITGVVPSNSEEKGCGHNEN